MGISSEMPSQNFMPQELSEYRTKLATKILDEPWKKLRDSRKKEEIKERKGEGNG